LRAIRSGAPGGKAVLNVRTLLIVLNDACRTETLRIRFIVATMHNAESKVAGMSNFPLERRDADARRSIGAGVGCSRDDIGRDVARIFQVVAKHVHLLCGGL